MVAGEKKEQHASQVKGGDAEKAADGPNCACIHGLKEHQN